MPKKLDRVEPVIYLSEGTARQMRLSPEDIVEPSAVGNYVFVRNKETVLDIRALQEEMKGKKYGVNRPIVAVGADGQTPTLLVADKDTDAYEVQDLLGETLEKQEKTMREQKSQSNHSPVVDTDWVRYVNGAPIGQKRADMVSEAIRDRIEKHKRNPVTDPFRDPWATARENGQLPPQISVPDNYEVKSDDKGPSGESDQSSTAAVRTEQQ